MHKKILQKIFTRDFCLATIETWYKAESVDPRQWTNNLEHSFPYQVYERKDGLISVYYDSGGLDLLQKEIKTSIQADPSFILRVEEGFRTKVDTIKSLLDQEPTLNVKELKDFSLKLRSAWVWFDVFWWLIDLIEHSEDKSSLKHLMETREHGQNFVPAADAIFRKSFTHLLGGKARYADVVLLDEVLNSKIPSSKVLEEREKYYIYTDSTLFTTLTLKGVEKKYSILLEDQNKLTQTDQIKGKCAYPGKIEGKVRLILKKDKMSKLNDGEILVTTMTLPEMTPAINKSAAVITDEGGILCHAAIIAREMKKPCIIGTKFATKVLRDGDLVEVDGENGIVRILKKKK
jgi:phosphohistidine swiveling domain-containing protein